MSCCIHLAAFRSRLKTASPRCTQRERGCTQGVASGAQATRSSAARYCLPDKWQRENALDTYEATFLERQTSSPPRFPRFSNPSSSPSPENDACLECDQQRVERTCQCVLYNLFFFLFFFFFLFLFYLDADNTLQNPLFPLIFNIRSISRFERFGTVRGDG